MGGKVGIQALFQSERGVGGVGGPPVDAVDFSRYGQNEAPGTGAGSEDQLVFTTFFQGPPKICRNVQAACGVHDPVVGA
jgi:hypothetical protein